MTNLTEVSVIVENFILSETNLFLSKRSTVKIKESIDSPEANRNKQQTICL